MENKQKGFAISLAIIIVALLIIGGSVYIYSNKKIGPAQIPDGPRIPNGPEIPDGGFIQNENKLVKPITTTSNENTKQTVSSNLTVNTITPPDSSSNSSNEEIAPILYLPYSTSSNLPSAMTPMGETIYHPKPKNPYGHGGIDFQWENPSEVPTITASMNATVTEIKEDSFWVGAYIVSTKSGKYGVDYTELGGVNSSLKVGDTIKVGDFIGYPQHPINITDWPNFRMIHWQFGYAKETRFGTGVETILCPMSYFAPSAKSSIEGLWANVDSPELKANAPDICSGDFAE